MSRKRKRSISEGQGWKSFSRLDEKSTVIGFGGSFSGLATANIELMNFDWTRVVENRKDLLVAQAVWLSVYPSIYLYLPHEWYILRYL